MHLIIRKKVGYGNFFIYIYRVFFVHSCPADQVGKHCVRQLCAVLQISEQDCLIFCKFI